MRSIPRRPIRTGPARNRSAGRIVMFGADPVELGFASSLTRSASSLTDRMVLAAELDAKRVELLHEALPSRQRIATLVDVSGLEPRRVSGRSMMLLQSSVSASRSSKRAARSSPVTASGMQSLRLSGASGQFASAESEHPLKRRDGRMLGPGACDSCASCSQLPMEVCRRRSTRE